MSGLGYALTYEAVGATREPKPTPAGFRAGARAARIGEGDERWAYATEAVMNWTIKRRSGFRVQRRSASGGARGAVRVGEVATLRLGPGILSLREPIRVVWVIDEPRRRGFGYGTLPGHPVSGEECFIVEHRDDDSVWLTTRSISRPALGGWRALWPVIRLAQSIFTRRYLAALAGPLNPA